MPTIGEYLAGAAFASIVVGLCAGAGAIAVARALPGHRGAVRLLAIFTLGSGAIVFAHLLPAAAGVLGRPAVAATAAALLGAARLVPRAAGSVEAPTAAREDPTPRASAAMAAAGVGLAVTASVAVLLAHAVDAVHAVDTLTLHLPQAVRYLQEGSIHGLHAYLADWGVAAYPQNGTMLLLAAVLPWDAIFAVRFVNAPFLLAAGVAVYLTARELGAPASAAALAGAAITTSRVVAGPALEEAQLDTPTIAWFASGALFLLRAHRSGSRAELALAGIALGLAFGTKWYAVACVPVLVALWLVTRRGRGALLLVATIAGAGATWLVRNWILIGNPVHPAEVRLLGLTIFDAPPDFLRERDGFTVSHYLLDGRVLRDHLIPAWWQGLGLLGPVVLAALTAAAATVRRAGAPAAAVVAAVALTALYTVMPDTAFGPPGLPLLVAANTRYLVPALMAGAVVAAWLATRGRRPRVAVEAGLLAAIVHGVVGGHGRALLLVPLVAAVVALGLPVARRRPRAAAIAALVVVLTGGFAASRTATFADFASSDPAVARLIAERPERVAIGGSWTPHRLSPVLPAFGPRLRSRVDYLGEMVRGTIRRHRRAALIAQLRGRRYDAVITGRLGPEAGWAAQAGYRRVVASPHLVLFLPR